MPAADRSRAAARRCLASFPPNRFVPWLRSASIAFGIASLSGAIGPAIGPAGPIVVAGLARRGVGQGQDLIGQHHRLLSLDQQRQQVAEETFSGGLFRQLCQVRPHGLPVACDNLQIKVRDFGRAVRGGPGGGLLASGPFWGLRPNGAVPFPASSRTGQFCSAEHLPGGPRQLLDGDVLFDRMAIASCCSLVSGWPGALGPLAGLPGMAARPRPEAGPPAKGMSKSAVKAGGITGTDPP